MATVEEVTDPLIRNLTPPPAARAGVCQVCHSWTETWNGRPQDLCSSCTQTVNAVSRPLQVVVPISLVTVRGSQFYTTLSGYKNSYLPDEVRGQFALRLGALLARFLRDHGACVRHAAGEDWDVITTVPSSSSRVGEHPLVRVVKMARAQHALVQELLEPAEADRLDHRYASDHGYRVTRDVGGARVLLIDDTFTTGARIQSAASALATANASVTAAVCLGRVVRPDYADEAQALWDERREIPFDFGVCCVGAH